VTSPVSAPRLRLLSVVLSALVLLVAACGSGSGPPELRGVERLPLPDVSGASLPDASAGGEPFAFVANPEAVLLVYFGFMSCPDVCPTTLADVRSAIDLLAPESAGRVDLAVVTVDPARDTGEGLTRYAQTFVPGAHALLTTDDLQLRAVADSFGAAYELTENEQGEVEVSHTGFLYGVDDEGRLRVTWLFGTSPEDLAHDLELLLS
jgi:protein SCO1